MKRKCIRSGRDILARIQHVMTEFTAGRINAEQARVAAYLLQVSTSALRVTEIEAELDRTQELVRDLRRQLEARNL